ncbi:hypothetical protein KCTCHS21_32370 [Cohnella abietis]|uniref:Uncharacterized protein n=1 Tax=Cohnella abietis TaxID=2507935 RepID=A0A3T1D6X5_9BACL|nr:hypothetical protein KCTCHS21_32370 [Cohnella abietis]
MSIGVAFSMLLFPRLSTISPTILDSNMDKIALGSYLPSYFSEVLQSANQLGCVRHFVIVPSYGFHQLLVSNC